MSGVLKTGPVLTPPTGVGVQGLLVLLHGFGADGDDLRPLGPLLQQQVPGLAVVCPDAPNATLMGYGRQWFSDAGWTFHDPAGMAVAHEALMQTVTDLCQRLALSPERVVLAGFSQGGMQVAYSLTQWPTPLAGAMVLAGALTPTAQAGLAAVATAARPPLWVAHGEDDAVVPVTAGQALAAALTQAGYGVTWHPVARAGHTTLFGPQVLGAMGVFLRRVLG